MHSPTSHRFPWQWCIKEHHTDGRLSVVSAALIPKLSSLMHRTIHRSFKVPSRRSKYQSPQSSLPPWSPNCHRSCTVRFIVHPRSRLAYLNINCQSRLCRTDSQTVIADAPYDSSFIQGAFSPISISIATVVSAALISKLSSLISFIQEAVSPISISY